MIPLQAPEHLNTSLYAIHVTCFKEYCDVAGSPCLSKTGPVVGPYFSIFGSLSLGKLCLDILHTYCAL